MLIRFLLANPQICKKSSLLQQLESTVCNKLFEGSEVHSLNLLSMYAFEFGKMSLYDFPTFFSKFFDSVSAFQEQLDGQHIETLAHIAIALATHRMVESEENLKLWNLLREATVNWLINSN